MHHSGSNNIPEQCHLSLVGTEYIKDRKIQIQIETLPQYVEVPSTSSHPTLLRLSVSRPSLPLQVQTHSPSQGEERDSNVCAQEGLEQLDARPAMLY